jgi:hypothetical protein
MISKTWNKIFTYLSNIRETSMELKIAFNLNTWIIVLMLNIILREMIQFIFKFPKK